MCSPPGSSPPLEVAADTICSDGDRVDWVLQCRRPSSMLPGPHRPAEAAHDAEPHIRMQDGMPRRPSRRSTRGSLEGDGSRTSRSERGGNHRGDAGRSNDSTTVRATRCRKLSPSLPSREAPLFCLSRVRHRLCSQEATSYGRETEDVPAVRRRAPDAAPFHAVRRHCLGPRVPGLPVQSICRGQSCRPVVIPPTPASLGD